MSTGAAPASRNRGFSIVNVLVVIVPVCLLVGAAGGWYYHKTMKDAGGPIAFGKTIRGNVEAPLKLDARFVDADNNLVADVPKEADKLLDPPELVFATLGSDEEEERTIWADFLKHLKAKTGKEVKLTTTNFVSNQQFASLTEGKTHILSLSTGQVPVAVNVGGFVPMCVMADDQGHFGYKMEIVTPAKSSVNSLQDLRGKRVAFLGFRSNSGFKLPVVKLWSELNMMPDRDYQWKYGNPPIALKWVKDGEVDAAAFASDYLSREVNKPADKRLLGPDDYRVIYTSDKTFPPACFGCIHNLKPELTAKIRDAFLSFDWKGTSLEAAYKAANQSKFVPINYKEHWAIVRDVEEQLIKFLDIQP